MLSIVKALKELASPSASFFEEDVSVGGVTTKMVVPRETAESIEQRRQEAIAKMGRNWVGHPDYMPQSKHSHYQHEWAGARTLRYNH
jgi:hypothetical protein